LIFQVFSVFIFILKGVFSLEKKNIEVKKEEKTFSKKAFLKSNLFKDKKDLIAVLLRDDRNYSKKEVYSIIDAYLKRSGF